MNTFRSVCVVTASCAALLLSGVVGAKPDAAQSSSAAGGKLPHQGERVAVAIYDFRSSVNELTARGATDMFVDALVHTSQFRVVERSQLNQSLLVEKQLSSQGLSDGAEADKKLRAAEYLFEGTISEANPSETQRTGALGVSGLSIGGGRNKDVLAIDVRVIDARTGDVLDSVTVRKAVKSTSSSVSGVGNFLSTVMAEHGKSSAYTPDVSATNAKKDSLDVALRDAIGEAVGQLASKF